jgi:thioredoxin-related protein
MADTKPKSTLDTIANIAIIVVCIVAVVVLVNNFLQSRRAQGGPGGMPPEAKKGEQFADLQGAMPAGTEKALFVAVQPGCHFCNESMPFYKRLMDERNQKGSNVKVLAAVSSDEAKQPEMQKFSEAGVTPDGIVKVDFAKIKVPGTPTLLLVDNQGKVLDVWVGKLDEKGEKKVIASL